MGINIFQVDAFTDKPFQGNPAGIVPCARDLTEDLMQLIAKEMNVSETVFIDKLDDNLFRVRFFTPTEEVGLCGHASIGAFFMLAYKHYVSPIEEGIKTIYQRTNEGDLPVHIHYKEGEVEKVSIELARPESYGGVKSREKLVKALGVDDKDLAIDGYTLEPEIISTGLKSLIVPVRTKEILDSIVYDQDLLLDLSKENDISSIHLVYKPDDYMGEVYTRNFAPALGIGEESATGTSNGASLYYLKKHNVIGGNTLISYQGESLDRPSKIYSKIKEDGALEIGGQARLSLDGILDIS